MDKRKQIERCLRGMKQERSREERKELERLARQRRAQRPRRKPRRRWSEEDGEDAGFEKLGSARGLPKGRKARRPLPPAGPLIEGQDCQEGRVVGLRSGVARVRALGDEVEAVLPPALALEQQARVAVGDRVSVEDAGSGTWRVVGVLPRHTSLSRPDPGHPARERVLAANVDRVVIVTSCVAPAFKPRLIDRMLVAVAYGGAAGVVWVNKSDLLPPGDGRLEVEAALEVYRKIGVTCLLGSAATGEHVPALAAAIRGTTAVFVGQSGTGKSSLLNVLDPEAARPTGAVRAGDGKGRHTTTASALHVLPGGTEVIDTPGVRAFGLAHLRRGDLRHWFPDFERAARRCRYRDCLHASEPGCGVRAAAAVGAIPPERLETYLRILETLDR